MSRTGAVIIKPVMRGAAVALVISLLAGCGHEDRDPPPGLFESQGTLDWDRVSTLAELAAQSDAVVLGTLVDVEEGYVFGSSIDDEFGTPEIELIIDTGTDEPVRLIWRYAPGYSLDEIRTAFPIGARLVVYATRFDVAESDEGPFHHHIGDADHAHWRWTNPQGVILEDPGTGQILVYNPSVIFDDAPPAGADLGAWLVEPLAFENPKFAGMCEYTISDFARDKPSPHSTEEQAAAQFVAVNFVLEGLEVVDGAILLRGEQVGSYDVISRPGGTFVVESAEWCYPVQ